MKRPRQIKGQYKAIPAVFQREKKPGTHPEGVGLRRAKRRQRNREPTPKGWACAERSEGKETGNPPLG